jgi:DoxX-like family
VNTSSQPAPPTKAQLWTGVALSALPVLFMLMSAALKLAHPPQVVESFTHQFGYSERALLPLAIIEICCALLYAIPRTAVLGAVLVTGFLGGAIATHVRIGDPGFVTGLALGIIAWGGLFFRDPRLRALLPLRTP